MDKSIGREVNLFINRINRQVSNIVSKYGITGSQAHIINFIYNESMARDVFQRDIEKEFDIRRSTTTNALQLMEAKGFILRQSVSIDARLKKVLLTEKGIIIQKKVSNIIMQSEHALRDKLNDNEYDTLVTIIEKLSNLDLKELKEETNNEN
ncbi:MAG: MarR family transcriptional regulator [Clostridia bacterium]